MADLMIFSPDHILVLGHLNPDTDASTSAHAYAEFLGGSRAYESPVLPAVLGELPPQSRFVFERAGVPTPPVIENLYPRVCHVATGNVIKLSVEDRFRHAVEMLIRSGHSMLPILDDSGKLQGIFSHRHDTSPFLLGFDVIPVLGRLLTWGDLLELPGAHPIGRTAAGDALEGRLHVAIAGDDAWKNDIRRDDLLLCGSAAVPLGLPPEKFPRWIVLVLPGGEPSAADLALLEERGAAVMIYRDSVIDFLSGLMSQVRIGLLDLGIGPCVGELDYIHDVHDVVSRSRHALPVLDAEGKLAGVISGSDLQSPPRSRVILIDHFDSSQTAPGIEHAEILEIVDHHRVGDIQTPGPVRVDCRPVGSSSTIVALRYFESKLRPKEPIAVLLLGGLLSDTLSLRSPTTTAVDCEVAAELGKLTRLPIEAFGREVLKAGDDILFAEPRMIWNRDQKTFSIRNRTFAVAQLETASLDEVSPQRLEEFRNLLFADFERRSLLVSVLFITDVLAADSWITGCESREASGVLAQCFGTSQQRPGWILAKGVVSRKKQVLPPLLRALAEQRF